MVVLSLGRTIVESLMMQGFVFDSDPDEFNRQDFLRSQIVQAVSSITDFIISLSILRLLHFKTLEAAAGSVSSSNQLSFGEIMKGGTASYQTTSS